MRESVESSRPDRSGMFSRGAFCLLISLLWSPDVHAQSADEHASHHPAPAGDAPAASPAGGASPATGAMPGAGASPAPAASAAGGMGAMGDMMKGMGGPKTKELYPALMDLPDLPLAKRHDIEVQAGERMRSGVTLMGESLDALFQATSAQNYSAMQASTATLREGLARFESGLAAQRALAEGKAPRTVALTWFKRDMNLLPPPGADAQHAGLGFFHGFIMVVLTGFFVVMICMYFFKMRRASYLLQRITDGGQGKPLPTPPTDAAKGATAPASPTPTTAAAATAPAASPKPPTPAAPGAPAAPAPPPAKQAGPVSRGWKGILRVSRIFDETPGVKTYRFTAMNGGPIPFTYLPGQFLIVYPMIDGKRTPRSYTMASSPTQRHYCELTIKREADGKGVSRYLHDGLQEGELLEASGPSGVFTFTGAESKSVVLIGGGVGITPLMSAIRYLTDIGWPGDIFLLFTCRLAADFIYRDELERLCARHPKLHMVATITRPANESWNGLTGRFTKEVIAQSVPDIATRLIHLCGPDAMMKGIRAALIELDVPAGNVKVEDFGGTIAEAAGGDDKGPTSGEAPVPPDVPPDKDPKPTTEGVPVAAAGTPLTTAAPPDAPAAPPDATEAPPPVAGVGVTFKKSNKTAALPPDTSILEAAEGVGVDIPYQCRVGTCGVCKVHMLSGAVTMDVEEGITPAEKSRGLILACQAKSTAPVIVDV